MNIRRVNTEVLTAVGPFVQASRSDVEELRAGALTSARRRMRLCAHPTGEDRIHEMLIAMDRTTYIRPHKHVNKSESMHVIEGSADAVFFTDDGAISRVVPLGDYASGREFYFRNSESVYHTLLINSDVLVVHETTNGPFNRADTIFASWAPEESDPAACDAFIKRVRRAVASGSTSIGP